MSQSSTRVGKRPKHFLDKTVALLFAFVELALTFPANRPAAARGLAESIADIQEQKSQIKLNHLAAERNPGASRCQKFRVEESAEQTPETVKAIHFTAWRRRSIYATDEEESLIRLMAFGAPSVTPINSDPSDAWQKLNNNIADSCGIMLVVGCRHPAIGSWF
ncbi:hypothetical protein DFH07DRAFT_774176 [Mycena maculata]|uniref:Uncharacterized protein n=1 Tax=Mycena maculata TaxID=230809 RepID=A0AAD7NBK3_9AGAR|nr:hypothetical protein DFH07DRAFT_774176 [Mycena maculata]